MPRAGDILDLSPIGAKFHVRRTAVDTGGHALDMEWILDPHSSGTPIHVHPAATESYEVLAGEFDVYVDGVWRTLVAGDRASVPPGVPHTFRNASASTARVYNSHVPAMRFGEYFETIHRVVISGAVARERMTLKAMLYLSMVMEEFGDEIRSVRPPQGVVRAAAGVARLLGYRVPPIADVNG